MLYYIDDEDNIPSELKEANCVSIKSSIGWMTVENPEFRVGCTYKIVNEETE
mgnify:CR=1 FL=1